MIGKPVRAARTQSGLPAESVVDAVVAFADGLDAPTAPLRMTIKPPRFTTTTPGVMRRLAR